MNKQQIIFFAGHDRGGKTSIAKALSTEIGIPYFKNLNEAHCFKTSFLNELHYKGSYLFEILEATGYSIIKDRDVFCEAAYSWAYNRETDIPFILDLDRKYRALNLHVILCYKTKLVDFHDHLITEDKIPAIMEGYHRIRAQSINPWLLLDTTDENLPEQLKKIRSFLGR